MRVDCACAAGASEAARKIGRKTESFMGIPDFCVLRLQVYPAPVARELQVAQAGGLARAQRAHGALPVDGAAGRPGVVLLVVEERLDRVLAAARPDGE